MFGICDDSRPEWESVGSDMVSEAGVTVGNHCGKQSNMGTHVSSESVKVTKVAELGHLLTHPYTI